MRKLKSNIPAKTDLYLLSAVAQINAQCVHILLQLLSVTIA